MNTYNDVRHKILAGDLIAFSGKGFFSRLIKFWTCSKISHVGVVRTVREDGRVEVIESTSLNGKSGVQVNRLSKRVSNYKGKVFWIPLSKESRATMNFPDFWEYLWKQDGKKYDFKQAIKAGLYLWSTRENGAEMFCSELVTGAYEAGGIIPETNASEMTPQDVCDLPIYSGAVTYLSM